MVTNTFIIKVLVTMSVKLKKKHVHLHVFFLQSFLKLKSMKLIHRDRGTI